MALIAGYMRFNGRQATTNFVRAYRGSQLVHSMSLLTCVFNMLHLVAFVCKGSLISIPGVVGLVPIYGYVPLEYSFYMKCTVIATTLSSLEHCIVNVCISCVC